MSFNDLIAEYKDIVQLTAFAEAQHRTISELSKKISKYEEEIKHLQKLLEQTNPTNPSVTALTPAIDINIADEEFICRTQLRILRERSAVDELTKEEAQKLEIYSKVLTSLNKKEDNAESKVEALDTKALLDALKE
jgi:hypothetical protein